MAKTHTTNGPTDREDPRQKIPLNKRNTFGRKLRLRGRGVEKDTVSPIVYYCTYVETSPSREIVPPGWKLFSRFSIDAA